MANLPRLSIDGSPLPESLAPLEQYRNAVSESLDSLEAQAAHIRANVNLSDIGKAEALAQLGEAARTGPAKFDKAVELTGARMAERTAAALRKAIGAHDGGRQLMIQQHLVAIDENSRRAELWRALDNGDGETLAAFHNAPAALKLYAGIDAQVQRRVSDALIDSADNTLRPELDAAETAFIRTEQVREILHSKAKQFTGTAR